MGVYVRFPDGSGHWDESLPDPNPNGGSVIDSTTGQAIPGAGRQSQSSGPGGNGVRGTQANPNGSYKAGPPMGGGAFGSQASGRGPMGSTPWADWVSNMLGINNASPAYNPKDIQWNQPAAAQPGQPAPAGPPAAPLDDWFTAWTQRQNADTEQQRMAANMQQQSQTFGRMA